MSAAILGEVRRSQPIAASLELWLRADAGLFFDSALTVPIATNGSLVGGWRDNAGLVLDEATNKPTLQTNVVSGLPVVRFDGSNDWLSVADPAALDMIGDQTFFAVARTGSASQGNILSHYETGGSPFKGWGLAFNQVAGKFSYWSSTKGAWSGGATTVNDNTWRLYGLTREGGTVTFYVNGSVDGIVTGHGNVIQSAALAVGAVADGASDRLNGDVAELLVYSRALVPSEIASVGAYLRGKYNLY